jgi:signal peptidase I
MNQEPIDWVWVLPGERPEDLMVFKVRGHCQEPTIMEGDIIIVNKAKKPVPSNFVVDMSHGNAWRYELDEVGDIILRNNFTSVKPKPDSILYPITGVVQKLL